MRELLLSLRPKNNLFVTTFWNWYYYDAAGKLLTGRQTIDGVQLYFDKNGKQAKGTLVDIDGDTSTTSIRIAELCGLTVPLSLVA